jgi:hypothetical protein
VWAFVMPIDPS